MIAHGLAFVNGRTSKLLSSWPRTDNLVCFPRAGRQLNAFYDGRSLKFFYGNNPQTGKTVFTCESSDVVTHELGHAILDTWRPDLWTVQSVEILAFHESFGDILAILAAFARNELIDFVLAETGGDLKKSNVVSRLAEEMGAAIYASLNRQADSLRNAVNDFKYTPPEQLPYNPLDGLGSEPHNFSRLFTGAFYDMLAFRHQQLVQEGQTPHFALEMARDQCSFILFNGLLNAAVQPRFFESVVRGMMAENVKRGNLCAEAISHAFGSRNMLPSAFAANEGFAIKMDGDDVIANSDEHGTIARIGGVKQVKLAEEMIMVQSHNPLYGIDIDIPNEHYVEFDKNGNLKVEVPVKRDEALVSAKFCLDYLNSNDKVSFTDNSKEFSVVDGKLVRNFICCRCRH
jgi:hypothetical protein